MKDGFILMRVQNGTVYPVAMTKEQVDTFDVILQLLPQPITVISNHPLGKAVNMINQKDGRTTCDIVKEVPNEKMDR